MKIYFTLTTIAVILSLLFVATTIYMMCLAQPVGTIFLSVLISLIFVCIGDFTYSKYKVAKK